MNDGILEYIKVFSEVQKIKTEIFKLTQEENSNYLKMKNIWNSLSQTERESLNSWEDSKIDSE